jgi:hypothetical protein
MMQQRSSMMEVALRKQGNSRGRESRRSEGRNKKSSSGSRRAAARSSELTLAVSTRFSSLTRRGGSGRSISRRETFGGGRGTRASAVSRE